MSTADAACDVRDAEEDCLGTGGTSGADPWLNRFVWNKAFAFGADTTRRIKRWRMEPLASPLVLCSSWPRPFLVLLDVRGDVSGDSFSFELPPLTATSGGGLRVRPLCFGVSFIVKGCTSVELLLVLLLPLAGVEKKRPLNELLVAPADADAPPPGAVLGPPLVLVWSEVVELAMICGAMDDAAGWSTRDDDDDLSVVEIEYEFEYGRCGA